MKTEVAVKRFNSSGLVYGRLWGGGRGAYTAKKLTASTKAALLAEIDKGIKEGWLDAGMGYESLIGGVFDIETVRTAAINGKEYINKEYETVARGKLDDKEKEFLYEIMMDQ